jgi:plastocyanin
MSLQKAVCIALMMLTVAGAAHAKDYTVVIHHMELETLSETFEVGDVLIFDNQSDMAHNLYITYEDGSVDTLDTQAPGMTRKVTLRQAGSAKIKCWIHPIINLDLSITSNKDAAP